MKIECLKDFPKNGGFTLIEMMVSIVITAFVMSALMFMVTVSLHDFSISGAEVNMQQNAQITIDHIGETIMESLSYPREMDNEDFRAYVMDVLSDDSDKLCRVIVLDKKNGRILTDSLSEKDVGKIKNTYTGTSVTKEMKISEKVPLAAFPTDNENNGYIDINENFDFFEELDIVDEPTEKEGIVPEKNEGKTDIRPQDPQSYDPLPERSDLPKEYTLSERVTSEKVRKIMMKPEEHLLSEFVSDMKFGKPQNGDLIKVELTMKIGDSIKNVSGKYRMRNETSEDILEDR